MNRSIATYFAGKILPAVINFLLVILAVKFLGKEEYGRYSLLFYIIMLIHSLAFGWIQQSILRFLSMYDRLRNVAAARFLAITLLATLFHAAVIFLSGIFYFDVPVSDLLLITAFIFLYNLFFFQLCMAQARLNALKYVLIENSYFVSQLLIFFILIYFFSARNYSVMFISMTGALLITQGIVTIKNFPVKKAIRFSKAFLSKSFISRVWRYGFPITLWLFGSYLFNVADRFFIKQYGGYDAVGIYSSVYDIIYKISAFLCVPVLLSFHPVIVKEWNAGNKGAAYQLVRKAIFIELAIMLFCLAAVLLLGDFLFNRLMDLNIERMMVLSVPLVVSAFLWQVSLFAHKPLELWFKQNIMLWGIIISLAVNISSNIFLIPLYGYQAAAYTTLLGTTIYLLWVIIYWRKNRTGNG